MNELELQASQAPTLWRNNPVLVQLLGLSPVLAVSTTVVNGIGLGVASCIVLTLSCLTMALLKGGFDQRWHFLYCLLIMAMYTTVVEGLLQWFYFPLYRELGIYVALICCNYAILLQVATRASISSWHRSLLEAAKMSAGLLLAIVLLAGLREFMSSGSLLVDWSLLRPSSGQDAITAVSEARDEFFSFARLQPAALILLGLLIACKNLLPEIEGNSADPKPDSITPVPRARVTAKL